MLSKQAKRQVRLFRIALQLKKLAQQYNLPGVTETDIDTSVETAKREEDRLDLSKLNLSDLNLFDIVTIDDIRKIIIYELKSNPEFPKQTIIDAVLNDAKEDLRSLIKEHLPDMPELRAKIPTTEKQLTLPGTPPDIKLFPTQEDIKETKERLDMEREEAIKAYDAQSKEIIDKYRAEHDGKDPDSWTLRSLMNYKSDPRDDDTGYSRKPSGKDIELDIEGQLTQGQYDTALKKLYDLYYSIEKYYSEIEIMEQKLETLQIKTELPAPEPEKFSSYRDMVMDLKHRTVVGLQKIISESVGIALFGMSGGGRHNTSTALIEDSESGWFSDPDELRKFLEEVPKVYNYKEQFVRSGYWNGYNANDVRFWMNEKYNKLKAYENSLKRTKDSFGKGVRFISTIDKKLNDSLESVLSAGPFKYADYIETAPQHRQKLNELYMEIVERINNTSRVMGRQSGRYNTGVYNDKYGHGTSEVDFGKMMASKTPQIQMLSSLTKLLLSSIKSVAVKINENELRPFVNELSNELEEMYMNDNLKLTRQDISNAIKDEKIAIKVAEAWLIFASNSKLSKNYMSVVRYPEFIYKDDKESAAFFVESMKEQLGRGLGYKLEQVETHIQKLIYQVVNSASFVYRGPEELRKEVMGKRAEIHNNITEEISKNSIQLSLVDRRYRTTSGRFIREPGEATKNNFSSQRYTKALQFIAELNDQNSADPSFAVNTLTEMIEGDRYRTNGRALTKMLFSPLKEHLRIRRNLLGSGDNTMSIFIDLFNLKGISSIIERQEDRDFNKLDEIDSVINALKLPETYNIAEVKNKFDEYAERHLKGFALSVLDLEQFSRIVKAQEGFNKEYNALLKMLENKLKYIYGFKNKLQMEHKMGDLFTERLNIFGGTGPQAMDGKFKEMAQHEVYSALPLQAMGKLRNEEAIDNLKEQHALDRTIHDPAVMLYVDLLNSSAATIAINIIVKKFSLKDAKHINELYDKIRAKFSGYNISKEDVEYIFPALITNYNAIDSQLEAAIELAGFAHNDGEGLSKQQILAIAQNPNFKDFIKDVDVAEKFFDAYIKITRQGGAKKLFADNRVNIKALVDTKAIRPGLQRRLQLIDEAFNNNTRINPSAEGFSSIKSMIEQVNYDLAALEKFETFNKYNTQIKEEKLEKDPELNKLNWNMTNDKFRFRVLKTFDPYHFQVGVDTDCCQKLGGVGEQAAIDSYINPLAGVLLLEILKDGTWKIASQSYFHYVPKDNGVILDNVEHNEEVAEDMEQAIGYNINQLYAMWADTKAKTNKYKYLLCGKGYNKLDNTKYKVHTMRNDPRDFKVDNPYTDWRSASSIDLLSPKFDLPEKLMAQKKRRTKRVEALLNVYYVSAAA